MARFPILLVLHSLLLFFVSVALPATFRVKNNCNYTVWPGFLSIAGTAPQETTEFGLEKGQSAILYASAKWTGRIWGRTLCSTDSTTGNFTCVTGDCGSGAVECSENASTPVTVAEFALDGIGGMDFYDVSLVDGYNLPMLVAPQQASSGGNCSPAGCPVDLNGVCPSELKVLASADGGSESVACKGACDAFRSPQYCCTGDYGSRDTCKPSSYSRFFKHFCPRAYSYPYDDSTASFTCSSATYVITFCPGTTSEKSAGEKPPPAGLSLTNNTMVFLSGDQASGSHEVLLPMPLAVVTASWLLSRHM